MEENKMFEKKYDEYEREINKVLNSNNIALYISRAYTAETNDICREWVIRNIKEQARKDLLLKMVAFNAEVLTEDAEPGMMDIYFSDFEMPA